MKQKDLSPRQHRWLDVLNEFDFEIEYIPGETNELADALSRIYSDKPEGIVRAETEYVIDDNEPIKGKRIRTHPIYVDSSLISIASTEVRRSSRLAGKPEINYSETRRRKPKSDKGDEPTVQDPMDNIGSGNESEDESNDSPTEDEPQNVPDLQQQLEEAKKLFRTMEGQDEPFPECLKGRYREDSVFKPILENPQNFANFKVRDGLVFFRLEGTIRLAILDVKINDQPIREAIIRQGHSMLAHLGGHKTLTYLRDQVWWKTMVQDVTDYCKSCQTLSRSERPR